MGQGRTQPQPRTWAVSQFSLAQEADNSTSQEVMVSATCWTGGLISADLKSGESQSPADYSQFFASCSVHGDDGTRSTSADCPNGENSGYDDTAIPAKSSARGNPVGICTVTFQAHPGVKYELDSIHGLAFNLAPGSNSTPCSTYQEPGSSCILDPEGFFRPDWYNGTVLSVPNYPAIANPATADTSFSIPCNERNGTCLAQIVPLGTC